MENYRYPPETYDFQVGSKDWLHTGARGNYHIVQYLRSCNLNIIPLRTDGTKAPKVKWTPYQLEQFPEADQEFLFKSRRYPSGIGIVCGTTSKFLELLDFDAPLLFEPWVKQVSKALGSDLIRSLVYVRTPKGGWHIYYRSYGCEGNQKLAYDADGKIQIETRGQGGQVVAPGSPLDTHPTGMPYRLVGGSFAKIPLIGCVERSKMVDIAKSFDQLPPKEEQTKDWVQRNYGIGSDSKPAEDRPGDDFNVRGDWQAILEPKGWTVLSENCGVTYWMRPGKTGKGPSATTGFCQSEQGHCLLKVFSSNAYPLKGEECYSKFTVYTILFHGGSFTAAAKELAKQGYGKSTNIKFSEKDEKLNEYITRHYNV